MQPIKHTLLALALTLALATPGLCAPALDLPHAYTQPDQSLFIGMRHGDEFFHWDTMIDVYPVAQGDDGRPSFTTQEDQVLKKLNKPLDPDNVPANAADLTQTPGLLARFLDERNQERLGLVESGGARWLIVMVDGKALAYAPDYPKNPVIIRDAEGYWCYARLEGDKLVPTDTRAGKGVAAPAGAVDLGQLRQVAGRIAGARAAARYPGQKRSADCPTCPHD